MTFLPNWRDPGRHRRDLRLHVGDAGLERVAVQRAGGDVVAFRDDVVGHLQLAGARRRRHDDMREKRAEGHIDLMLRGEFLDDFGAALRVGAVVLGDDLDLPAGNAAIGVDEVDGGSRGALVPAAISGADAGSMHLEADADRLRGLRLGIAETTRQELCAGNGAGHRRKALHGASPSDRAAAPVCRDRFLDRSVMLSSPVLASFPTLCHHSWPRQDASCPLRGRIGHPYTIHWMEGRMADNVRQLRERGGESEKITINLGYVDLGRIDLLVQEGFYSNRTDFIRTAIRNQLATHAEPSRSRSSGTRWSWACATTAGPISRR